jgi:O-antigen chain-terminating methyltransferase
METRHSSAAINELRQLLSGAREESEQVTQKPAGPITLESFLELAPDLFVDQAYRQLLGREADLASRKQYITALLIGALDRIEILDELCQSVEGRACGVQVAGLQSRAQQRRLLFGIPFFGRLLRLARWVKNMPSLLRACAEMCIEMRTEVRTEMRAEALQSSQRFTQFSNEVLDRHHRAEQRLDSLDSCLDDLRMETRRAVAEQRRCLLELNPTTWAIPLQLSSAPSPASSFSNSIYAAFEDAFRGSPEQVRQGLVVYLPLIHETADRHPGLPVVDLGCGRGEWLELLAQERIPSKGVDLNPVVVEPLVAVGFDVVHSDVFAFLAGLPDASAVAVTSFHLIEHLPYDLWIPFLDQIRRILVPGGIALVETPNPRNILVGSGDFYRDPTHRAPVFPDTLSFFGQMRGFDDSMAWYFVDGRSRLIPAEDWRFDTLDDYVRISRDYVWIGRKNI